MANNPCIDGLNKIQTFYRERNIHFPVACMVSLGTGIFPTEGLGSVDFQGFLRLRFSGMFKKAQSLVTMLSSAVSVWKTSKHLVTIAERSLWGLPLPYFVRDGGRGILILRIQ